MKEKREGRGKTGAGFSKRNWRISSKQRFCHGNPYWAEGGNTENIVLAQEQWDAGTNRGNPGTKRAQSERTKIAVPPL